MGDGASAGAALVAECRSMESGAGRQGDVRCAMHWRLRRPTGGEVLVPPSDRARGRASVTALAPSACGRNRCNKDEAREAARRIRPEGWYGCRRGALRRARARDQRERTSECGDGPEPKCEIWSDVMFGPRRADFGLNTATSCQIRSTRSGSWAKSGQSCQNLEKCQNQA